MRLNAIVAGLAPALGCAGHVKRAICLLLGCLAVFHYAHAADTFSFEMPDPKLRIVVPDIPQMKMGVHPNAAQQPHARYFGGDDTGYSISILMPTADAGMTPRECANSISRSVVKQFGVDPKYVNALQNDDSTFVVIFPIRVDTLIQ